MKSLLGKKIGMSRVYDTAGRIIPITLIELGPCVVTALREAEKDGYQAVQLAYGLKKKAKKGTTLARDFRFIREFKTTENFEKGQILGVSIFKEGEKLTVIGTSKGKGFTGVVKRHGFKGAPATHGHKHDLRAPGAIGSVFPQHVIKGRRMAGREGNQRVTVKALPIMRLELEKNLVALKGSVPGRRNSYLQVYCADEVKEKEVKK